MPGANNPFAAKSAAPLVNPTGTAAIFIPFALIPITAQTPYSAFVKYDVFNTALSSTTQTPLQIGGQDSNTNCVAFTIRAYGRVTGGTTTNWTPTLYFGRSQTTASNTVVGSLSAGAFNSASGVYSITADLIWDATSGQISGTIGGLNGATAAISANALVTPVTGQTAAVQNAAGGTNTLFFSLGGLFSATNANNIAYMDYFAVEVK
jgi:hypothetical protein